MFSSSPCCHGSCYQSFTTLPPHIHIVIEMINAASCYLCPLLLWSLFARYCAVMCRVWAFSDYMWHLSISSLSFPVSHCWDSQLRLWFLKCFFYIDLMHSHSLYITCDETHHPGLQTHCRRHPEVQNSVISGPTKRTDILQIFFKKRLNGKTRALNAPRWMRIIFSDLPVLPVHSCLQFITWLVLPRTLSWKLGQPFLQCSSSGKSRPIISFCGWREESNKFTNL